MQFPRVSIDTQSSGHAGVPEAFADLHVLAVAQQDRRVRVTKIVKPDHGHGIAEIPGAALERVLERLGEGLRVPKNALVIAEHESIAADELERHRTTLGLPGAQDSYRGRLDV